MQVVGVDGYPRGWVAVSLVDGRFQRASVFPDIASVAAEFLDAACIGVDIPIGPGPREADRLARVFVGPRRSSVFPAPEPVARAALNYGEAGGRISRQAFGLVPKILEVERAAAGDPRIVEVHPEVCFAGLKGAHLEGAKTTWNGFMERRRLLAGAGIEIPEELDEAGLPLIDVLDACVAAWSALRWVRGEAESLGDETARIWY